MTSISIARCADNLINQDTRQFRGTIPGQIPGTPYLVIDIVF